MGNFDFNFAGLKNRVNFRLQDLPRYTDELLGIAVNKAVEDLLFFIRNRTVIYQAKTFILQSGAFAGLYASEYPLPGNTWWVDEMTFDGLPLEPTSLHEMVNTGITQITADGAAANTFSGTPRWYMVMDNPNGQKSVILFPRPDRAAYMQFWGGLEPTPLVNPGDVPNLSPVFATPIEFYGAWYLTEGQVDEQARSALLLERYRETRNEAKLNHRLDRVDKTIRWRDFP